MAVNNMADNKYQPRLKVRYREEISGALKERLGLVNVMQVPGLDKIVVNMGVGDAVNGAKATLRGDRRWEFFDRLLSVALPRIRDFRGLRGDSFDGRGNYTFGVTEQLIFPEVDYDDIDKVCGMDITIVTTATTDEQGRAFLEAYGFPFADRAVTSSP